MIITYDLGTLSFVCMTLPDRPSNITCMDDGQDRKTIARVWTSVPTRRGELQEGSQGPPSVEPDTTELAQIGGLTRTLLRLIAMVRITAK